MLLILINLGLFHVVPLQDILENFCNIFAVSNQTTKFQLNKHKLSSVFRRRRSAGGVLH